MHPGIFSPVERSGALDDARMTMWNWAEPVIIDRAVEAYGRAVDATGTIAMARQHCRLWRYVLLDQPAGVATAMDDLRCSVGQLGLADRLIDDVNDVILEELVDIVMGRYRSSRNAIKAFSLILMSATSRLGPERVAA